MFAPIRLTFPNDIKNWLEIVHNFLRDFFIKIWESWSTVMSFGFNYALFEICSYEINIFNNKKYIAAFLQKLYYVWYFYIFLQE